MRVKIPYDYDLLHTIEQWTRTCFEWNNFIFEYCHRYFEPAAKKFVALSTQGLREVHSKGFHKKKISFSFSLQSIFAHTKEFFLQIPP